MSAFLQRALLQSEGVLVQSKRFHGKINFQRPRLPHFTKKLFLAVTQPQYPRKTAIDFCHEKQAIKELEKMNTTVKPKHPYEAIMSKELFEFFDSSKMILLCQRNSMTAYEFFNFKVALHKKNVKTKVYSRTVIRGAIADTKFQTMLPLLTQTQYSCMLFSDEWNVGDVLNVLKKTPKMLLLAGSLDDKYMSRSELEDFAKLPDLTTVRAQFVATLNSVGGQLTNHLQAHQTNFARMLDTHAEALKSAATGTSSDQPTEKSA